MKSFPHNPEPALPSIEDAAKAHAIVQALEALAPINQTGEFFYEAGERRVDLVLPNLARRLLEQLLREIAQGHAVSLMATQPELTTQQAADLLNVSRPFLVSLLESGAMPHRKVGTRRRVRLDHLLAYKKIEEARQSEALDKLAQLSESLGINQ